MSSEKRLPRCGPAVRLRGRLAAGCALAAVLVIPSHLADLSAAAAAPSPVGVPGTWQLSFQDEFATSSLDSDVWTPHRGDDGGTRADPFNPDREDEGFAASQVSVSGGALGIGATREPITIGSATYAYTSGTVHSAKGLLVSSGYVEARMWVPADTGYWPAFWLTGKNTWPPEIDIAEFFADSTKRLRPTFNVHWGTWQDHQQQGPLAYGNSATSYTSSWHTYGLKWDRTSLQVYVDGVAGPRFTGSNVPTMAMVIIFDLAVHKGARPADATMLVDYLRIWQPG